MTKKSLPNENEVIPVSSARLMAFLTISMSLGFVFILYFFFLKDLFVGAVAALVFAIMITLSIFSALVALGSIRKKTPCPICYEEFFAKSSQMFFSAKNCTACGKPLLAKSKR